jgi:hypothetical protein
MYASDIITMLGFQEISKNVLPFSGRNRPI